MDTEKLKNHFVICGWKEDIQKNCFFTSCPERLDMEAKDIVIVAEMSEHVVDSLKQHPQAARRAIGGFRLHSRIKHLRRAAPQRARRILILADQSPNQEGKTPTESEIDARTIMAAMTLSQIARGILVAAEIIDPKMDHYLKIANVSEVIYTREYSRLILGNATAGTGIANVLYEILSPQTKVKIVTVPIPDPLIGKTWVEVKRGWTEHSGPSLLLGACSKTRATATASASALCVTRKKPPNMNDLVSNLKRVKSLQFNHPVFSPPNDYQVLEGSLAIILENQYGAADHDESSQQAA